MRLVTQVVDVRVTVVDLEEPLLRDHRQFLGGDRVAEVRMVEVDQDGTSQPPGLLLDGGQVVGHDLDDALAALGLDQLQDVAGVHVDRLCLKPVGDLLALDQQEASGLLEQRTVLAQRLEPDLEVPLLGTGLDPGVPEPLAVAGEAVLLGPIVGLPQAHPPLPLAEDVVVGEGEELVAVAGVPVHDHLRVVIAVAPERVGVQVALEPPRLGVGRHRVVRLRRRRGGEYLGGAVAQGQGHHHGEE